MTMGERGDEGRGSGVQGSATSAACVWPGERRCPRVPLCVSSATTVSSVQNVRECLRAAHCALCVMVCVGLLCVHVLVCPRLSSPMCMVSLIWLVALRCVCVVSEMNGVGQLGMTFDSTEESFGGLGFGFEPFVKVQESYVAVVKTGGFVEHSIL